VLQLDNALFPAFSRLVTQAWRAFNELDFALLEINPLVLREDGDFMCADAKVTLDDNALYRHPNYRRCAMKRRRMNGRARPRSLI
jgi:succinyl-CoA synthetase beta subunit